MASVTLQPNDVILRVENPSILASLKKILKAIPGVTVVSQRKKKTIEIDDALAARLEKARDEIRRGDCVTVHNNEELEAFLASL